MKEVPQAIEVETALLGCLLLNPALLHQAKIEPEMFYDLKHQKIVTAMKTLEKIDLVTVNHVSQVPVSYLVSLVNSVATTTGFLGYYDIVLDKYIRRELWKNLEVAIDDITSEKTIEETLQKLKQIVLKTKSGKYEVLSNPTLISKWYDDYDKPVQRLKTGIATIDYVIGGFSPTDFALILADTNVGKTTLLLNMMISMAKAKKHVLFFSLEMTANQLNDKLIAMFGKHHAFDISTRATPKDQLVNTVTEFAMLPITVVHKGAITSQDVVSEAYNRRLMGQVDVVMVDYIQRLSDQSRENETIRMKNIAMNLKNFALVNEIPVITPAQVDKESSKGGAIRVENVAWAKALADEADLAVYLYEKEKGNGKSLIQETNYKIEKELRLRVVKSRHSQKGDDILINFDRSSLRMTDDVGEIKNVLDVVGL